MKVHQKSSFSANCMMDKWRHMWIKGHFNYWEVTHWTCMHYKANATNIPAAFTKGTLFLVLNLECCVGLKLATKVIKNTNTSRVSRAEYTFKLLYVSEQHHMWGSNSYWHIKKMQHIWLFKLSWNSWYPFWINASPFDIKLFLYYQTMTISCHWHITKADEEVNG